MHHPEASGSTSTLRYAQAHEYLAVLGASMRKAKSESGGGSSGEAATAYRGVTSKPVSLAGVTHTLYESNYEHKLLGTFITAPEAAAAFAKHVHMTYGLNAPEEDPFARPDTASAAARSSASAIPGGSVGLAILARLAAAAPTATAGSSSSAPAKKYSEVKYQSHAPKDGKGGNKGKGRRRRRHKQSSEASGQRPARIRPRHRGPSAPLTGSQRR